LDFAKRGQRHFAICKSSSRQWGQAVTSNLLGRGGEGGGAKQKEETHTKAKEEKHSMV